MDISLALAVPAIFVALFLLVFLTGRRFGVLGLALAAGVLLAQYILPQAIDFLGANSNYLGPFTAGDAAAILVTLAPSLILLIHGPRYHSIKSRILGALLYAVMATTLILTPITNTFPLENAALQSLASTMNDATNLTIMVGIAIAVLDLLFSRGKSSRDRK